MKAWLLLLLSIPLRAEYAPRPVELRLRPVAYAGQTVAPLDVVSSRSLIPRLPQTPVAPMALSQGVIPVRVERAGAFSGLQATSGKLADSHVDRAGSQWLLAERFDGDKLARGRYESDGRSVWITRVETADGTLVQEHAAKPVPELAPEAFASISLKGGGVLVSNIETKESAVINAKAEFRAALRRFGPKVRGIKGTWVFGDNLAEFNRLTALGLSPEDAALGTWTGQRAAEAGFTKVVFSQRALETLNTGTAGAYEHMTALFVRPDAK